MHLHEGAGPDGRISRPNMFDQADYPASILPEGSGSARGAGDEAGGETPPEHSAVGDAGTRKLVINGRFLTQPLTGVQRYAREVVKAMDTLAAERHPAASPWDIELHHPPGDIQFDTYRQITIRQTGKRTGHLWEQIDLCASAKGRLLLNLANTAPVLHPAIVGTIHDVGVFAHGSAYSASFRLSYRLMFRFLVRRARRLFTVSSFSAQEIGRYCGIPPDTVAVAPNAADHIGNFAEDPEILDRLGLKPQEFVLAVGSRNPLKNLATVVRAFDHLGPDRPRLVIVGQRSAAIFQNAGGRNAAGQNADSADDDFLVPTGEISDGALRTLYRNAQCLVFPSFYEGFGIPPLEAMQEGCPVIASAASAIPEVCGDAILYCDPNSADDIAARIRELGGDGDLRQRLIHAGRERAAHYSWRNTALAIFGQLNGLKPL
jgi:glycosyltransferase involved in cell wall biosynthesis